MDPGLAELEQIANMHTYTEHQLLPAQCSTGQEGGSPLDPGLAELEQIARGTAISGVVSSVGSFAHLSER